MPIKVKLAVLWLFIAITNSAIIIITYLEPGIIDNIREGHVLGASIEPNLLLIIAITYFWIPLAMAVLSVMLKKSINRWANIIAGIVYGLFIINELIANILEVFYPYGMLMQVSEFVVILLIVWQSWKWAQIMNEN